MYKEYELMLEDNLARELARVNLPLSLYTEWYWKIDLHNLFHFLKLRMDKSYAQREIVAYADVMAEITKKVVPVAYEAFEDYVLNAQNFSRLELMILKEHLSLNGVTNEFLESKGFGKREADEFLEKLQKLGGLNESSI